MKEICRQIYDYIKEQLAYEGSPSVRDICESLGIKSTSTVHRYLNELEEAGLIVRSNNKHRYITLTDEPVARVPILGNIAAGIPITAIEEVEGYIPFSDFSGDFKDLFALRIRGESMINLGILDGDVVILRQCSVARNGQIVAALVDDEATLKRFYQEDGHYRLQPENDAMEPIIVDHVEILGILVASYRRYKQ